MSAVVYLGLGSNLGSREGQIAKGSDRLERYGVDVDRRSSLYETEPVGVEDQPWFVNQVVEGRTDLSPAELLAACKRVERELGRTESIRFGPRVLDIDILLYGDRVIDDDGLEIPHLRMTERRFVLIPLLEIAPGLRDPRSGTKYADILNRLDEGKKVFQSLQRES
ncbi:2-amino-4-hydroxy-6-hydroxymethyldihydropteridine diphosphokinase [Candidatus Bipolaricaulota bacterium]|nr:2-amino-4-hydroxy-6-hydroxymethyldihydropteridine diphosphokinase [Candidatus Bipolaricaulota bacterium]